MKYEASIVYAFTPLDNKDKAHGNPALVVFGKPTLNDKVLISKQARVELNNEMMELPIIDFIEVVDLENNIFNIEYFLCSGMEISICGHGTMCAVMAIINKYKKENKKQIYTFNLSQNFEENKAQPQLKIESDGVYFRVEFDDVGLQKVDKKDEVYNILQKNIPDMLENSVYYGDLKDYMCISSNAESLRNLVFPLDELKKIRKIIPDFRGVFVVAKSDKDGYDYETTVLSDGLPAPIYKDPACGSANKEVPKFIKETNMFPYKFKNGDIENFKMYYPYRYSETGIMGGIQDVEYKWKEGKVFVVSGARFSKNLILNIDESGNLDF